MLLCTLSGQDVRNEHKKAPDPLSLLSFSYHTKAKGENSDAASFYHKFIRD